jgi:hypothetical protein
VLTLFSTPKPFEGQIGIIQRNALWSWKLLHPEVEVILFGDEPGTAEICHELGLLHMPHVERTRECTKLVRSVFGPAQEMARHDLVCYSNCDIILGHDFLAATSRVSAWRKRFLMVGRRWDSDIVSPVDFSETDWNGKLKEFVLRTGVQRLYYNVDYFAFSKGLYTDIPPLAIGRVWWDHWLIWKASQRHAAIVDASDVVMAMHQNHDYAYHAEGQKGVWYGAGAKANFKIAGGYRHLHTLEDATHRLTERTIEPRRLYWLAPVRRSMRRVVKRMKDHARVNFWHPFLGATRGLRHNIGLRHENVRISWKKSVRRHELDR